MIRRLEHDIATRIAAGEVIERPSSVAKELIENSIDASASSITLYVEQGGKASFVIEDDGIGIACAELPLALERYATSKISSIEDLERIATLGYRGEALASVAAVSRMEIRSRQSGAETGGLIRSEGGSIVLHTDNPCQHGTRIEVDDLFFNLPARRKFLKTASAELRRIIQIVNDYALIHPDITFRLFSDGKRILEYLRTESVDDALTRRWGLEVQKYYSESFSGPCRAKIWWNPIPDSKRVVITLFANGRRIQDSTVRAAICGGDAAAYGEWLILLDIPPEQLDVNIHPTKEEVRFRRSQDIFKLVYDNARNIFAKKYSMGDGPFSDLQETLRSAADSSAQGVSFDRNTPIFSSERWPSGGEIAHGRVASSAETIFIPASTYSSGDKDEPKNYIGQTANGFLLFDFPEGLAIIDPHAAHERILFEDISASFKDSITVQNLTIPLEIPIAILPDMEINSTELRALGFTTDAGALTGVPLIRGRGHLSPIDMLRSAIRGIEMEQDPAKRDREVWWRLARLACRDAVKLGQRFIREEALALIERLEQCSDPYTCPHGRPTVFIIANKKLEEWFER